MHRTWRWSTGLAAAALLAGTVAATGGVSAAASGPSHITLTEGVQTEPNWWLPNLPSQYCTTENSMFSTMAYRPLLWVSNSDTVQYPQSIASGIAVTKDDTVFTVHLGTRFKWSNGQTVNAYDALFAANLLLATSQNNAVWVQCGQGIGGVPADWKSVTAPNSRTLVITTKVPVNPVWFEENGIGQIYPIPKSVWDHSSNMATEESWLLKTGQNVSAPQLKVVDGPYAYGAFANNDYATLVANPHYTGPDPAHISKITFLYETSESNLWAAAERGLFAQIAIPSQYTPSRTVLERSGYRLSPTPYGFCFNMLRWNLNPSDPVSSLFHQLYIRQALQMSVNQVGWIRLADNIGFQEYGPVPAEPRTVYYDPAVANDGYSYNPNKVKALLEAHGWKLKGGLMTNAKGQHLTFSMLYASGSTWVTDAAELYQANLKSEGITLSLSQLPFNQVVGTMATTHTWEMGWDGGGWCYEPDYYPTGAGLFVPGAAANRGQFDDPALTATIDATHAAGTPAQEMQRMFHYELAAAKDLPVMFLPVTGTFTATQGWLHAPASDYNSVQAITEFNLWSTSAR